MLLEPPYLWGVNVGLLSLGGFVGTVIGLAVTFATADLLITGKAKKESHGLAEPESRLPAMFPALFLATTGIWTFGFSAANPSPHAWAGMAVGYGMVGYGITQIPSIGFNYVSCMASVMVEATLMEAYSSSTPTTQSVAIAS